MVEIKVPSNFFDQLTTGQIPVFNFNPDKLEDYIKCMNSKCLQVSWNFTKYTQKHSNIIFYQIFYRKL